MRILLKNFDNSSANYSKNATRTRRHGILLKSASTIPLALLFSSHAFAQTTVSSDGNIPAGTYNGILVDNGAAVTGTGVNSSTEDASAIGLEAIGGSSVNLTGSVISTLDTNGSTNDLVGAYGVYAHDGSSVGLTGGSVSTLGEQGRVLQEGNGSRSYALYAAGEGSSITADGANITTLGQRSYGAYAVDGATIGLSNLSIDTDGFMAYGVYASGAGSTITADNVDVSTNGSTGDAAWAYSGGHLILNGGTYAIQGEQNPNAPHETANGLVALGGVNGVGNGVIDATDLTVDTYGANSVGILAGGDVGDLQTSGTINMTNSAVTVHGDNSIAAQALYGSTLNVTGGTLTSTNGVGVQLTDNATVTLTGVTVAAGQQSLVSDLQTAGRVQSINIGDGSVLTGNNGTLLLVNRTAEGADGQVDLRLGAGSMSSGDILDNDEKTGGGYTDVFVSSQASWTGLASGVRNFTTDTGGAVEFEGKAEIQGNLDGNDTDFTFSDQGGTIGGDVTLRNGSTTTGGSLADSIYAGGNVDVDVASVLGGNWNIAGNVVNNGTTNPGNSIGTIAVGGNYTFGPASTYNVEVNAAGQSDLVQVGGVATLGGAVTVTPLGGVRLDAPYTIVSAGSIAGTFESAAFSGDYPFLGAELGYTPTSVLVTVVRNGVSYVEFATTPNQAAVATSLDGLLLNGPLAQAIGVGTAANAVLAFDQLSGEVHASLRTGLFEDSRHVRNAMTDRLAYRAEGLSLWGSGFGSWGETGNGNGTARLDRNTKGILLGLDTSLGGKTRIGVMGGYSTANYDVDGRGSSADVKNYHAGVYAGSKIGGFSIGAGAAYTWHRIDVDRAVAFAGITDSLSSRYNGYTAQAFGDIGYAFPVGAGEVGPFANVAYVRLHTDGFTEAGGAAALSVASRNDDVTFSTIGLRASAGLGAVRGHGMIGWRHAFNDRLPTIQAAFVGSGTFSTQGVPLSKEAAVIDLGLDTSLGSAASIGVSYSGQIGSDSSDNGVKANFKIRF
ncbi:autotransporter domain-containing protein [Sphingomonas sp. dw_22]|uniref:autotransporter outer membrane beta-barrel domain-containing protein n=1 Tax=Sphingomonas sp. dw_22 TaxID=2721175 RepID=UPI001BD6A3FA|nr:autotransporter domain-containing protein [Sphingomonas sp. dw_22]